jgi:hypothetical protein
MSNRSDVAWSCVLDDTPHIWASVVPWLATATGLAQIAPSQIYVHHVCMLPPRMAELCEALKVHTRKIEPFDHRYPHTNKIRQCATTFSELRRVVLTDVDVVFTGVLPIDEIQEPVAGKLVDGPNPPMRILEKIFSTSGVRPPRTCTKDYVNRESIRVEFHTLLGNYNGGLYVIDHAQLKEIGEAWSFWARWLIANIGLLARWSGHVDQVSFCLAVSQLQIDAGVLADKWNFPLHRRLSADVAEPLIMHHHALLDDRQRIRKTPGRYTRKAIARVNDAIEDFQRKHFPGIDGAVLG